MPCLRQLFRRTSKTCLNCDYRGKKCAGFRFCTGFGRACLALLTRFHGITFKLDFFIVFSPFCPHVASRTAISKKVRIWENASQKSPVFLSLSKAKAGLSRRVFGLSRRVFHFSSMRGAQHVHSRRLPWRPFLCNNPAKFVALALALLISAASG